MQSGKKLLQRALSTTYDVTIRVERTCTSFGYVRYYTYLDCDDTIRRTLLKELTSHGVTIQPFGSVDSPDMETVMSVPEKMKHVFDISPIEKTFIYQGCGTIQYMRHFTIRG